jgi:predicted phosphodiesterase
MRIAIISDIHSNFEALSAVLEDVDNQGVDEIFCLGDIIGYGASPSECLALVRKRCKKILMGNHDHAAVGLTDKDYFNPNAKSAIVWTIEQLENGEMEFLSDLDFTFRREKAFYAHANLSHPREWGYILDEYQASASFKRMGSARILFIGHSHVPVVLENGPHIRFLGRVDFIRMEPERQYIINVGSVGQPRDGINDAAYALFDTEENYVHLVRVPYDIQSAQKKILDAGLPEFLAERIQYGR